MDTKKMEHECNARPDTQLLIRSCRMGCRFFIIKVIEDTWVLHLQYPDSFYTCVNPRDILDLLATQSGGLERADVVAMFSTMHL